MASLVASSRKTMGYALKFKKGKSGNERKHGKSRHENFTFGSFGCLKNLPFLAKLLMLSMSILLYT